MQLSISVRGKPEHLSTSACGKPGQCSCRQMPWANRGNEVSGKRVGQAGTGQLPTSVRGKQSIFLQAHVTNRTCSCRQMLGTAAMKLPQAPGQAGTVQLSQVSVANRAFIYKRMWQTGTVQLQASAWDKPGQCSYQQVSVANRESNCQWLFRQIDNSNNAAASDEGAAFIFGFQLSYGAQPG